MKILFLAESVSLAHIGRPLKLAKWAFGAGHEVHFACSNINFNIPGYENLPFKRYELNCIAPSTFYARLKEGNFPYTLNELQQYQIEETKLFKEIYPDLVVCDFRLSASVTCELLNIPVAQISNLHWSKQSTCEFLPDLNSSLNNLPIYLTKLLMKIIRPIAFRKFALPINRLRKLAKLKAIKDFRDIYTAGNYTLFADMPQFTQTKELPANQKVIGPIFWGPEISSSNNPTPFNSKIIYVTLGSSGNSNNLKNLLITLIQLKRQIIISGVDENSQLNLENEIPNLNQFARFIKMVNPNDFLHKCSLTICHGGSGTVYQSLAAGVPVFSLPSNPDQYLVSIALKKKQLGNFLFVKKPSIKLLKQKIESLLNNNLIEKNCQLYAKEIKIYHTQSNWLNFLDSINTKYQRNVQTATTRRLLPPKKESRPTAVSIAIKQTSENIIISNVNQPNYNLSIATNTEDREAVYKLAYRIYREKGYTPVNEKCILINQFDSCTDTTVLVVKDKEKVIGSVTLIFDKQIDLPASKIFNNEINSLRNQNQKIVEISRLVIDPEYRNSKEILRLLFNHLLIYSYHIKKYSCLLIEVNPRHQKFYQDFLAFSPVSHEKPCPYVENAPAILMVLPLEVYRSELHRCTKDKLQNIIKKERSLYATFLNAIDEIPVAIYLESQFKPITLIQKEYFGLLNLDNRLEKINS